MLDLRIERDKDSQIEKARNLVKCVKFLFMACVWDLACAQRLGRGCAIDQVPDLEI